MSRYRILDQQGLTFITCTVVGWIDIFTRQTYRKIILDSLTYNRKEKGLLVRAYIIMSNHIHLILQTGPDSKYSLSDILRDFKKYTAQTILETIQKEPERRRSWLMHMFKYYAKYNTNNREHQFWIQNNHPIFLYSDRLIWQKVHYIHMNPVKAGIVEKPEDYLYSSARNYLRENKDCLIEIDLLDSWWTNVGRI